MNKIYLDSMNFVSANRLETISFENETLPDYVTSIHDPLSASEEISFECEVNPQLFEKLVGVDLSQRRDLISLTISYQVQARRHKKKRINKKWAKRYGYKTKFKTVRITDAQFKQDENDFEFTGRRMCVC